jgi:CRP-like cAMP-binding protein
MQVYLSKIEAFIEHLDMPAKLALEDISSIRHLKKGDFLVRQDEICRYSYWIQAGVVRKFYLHDGKEITTELLFENDIAVSLESYVAQKPGREFIQALSDTSVSRTNYEQFQAAKMKHPKLLELDLMITEYHALWLENRLFEFHTLNAAQRYSLLLKEHPRIIQNVPLTHIASYLGISLETLSRIRAKI